jgi:ABC-type cobalamin/Fe3+-siderophores transport system ATPase subunit
MLLRVNLLSAGYINKKILDDIHFELPEGRILALIGPNGCGKTTLIRAISGTLPDMHGELHVNGTDLTTASPMERARLVAVVPQSTHIPPAFLVEDVVLMGRTPFIHWSGKTTPADQAIALDAMRKTDVLRFQGRYCGDLSAGERQRVILARALSQDTPVLLMDEPTSHLDLRYQIEFLELTMKLAVEANKTVMVALHDLNLAARFGDEVLAMKDGRVVMQGKAREVLNPETIGSIYGLPVSVFEAPGKRQLVILWE